MRYPASEKLEIIRLVDRPTWASGPLWTSRALRRPPFIAGTIAFWPLATPVLRIATAARAGCGTGSRMMSGGRSSILPWRRRNCRPGNWPSGLRTPGATLSRMPRFSGFSRPTTRSPAPTWSSRQPMSSATRPRRRTSCGRPTSPISRSSACWFYLSLDDYTVAWKRLHQHDGLMSTATLRVGREASCRKRDLSSTSSRTLHHGDNWLAHGADDDRSVLRQLRARAPTHRLDIDDTPDATSTAAIATGTVQRPLGFRDFPSAGRCSTALSVEMNPDGRIFDAATAKPVLSLLRPGKRPSGDEAARVLRHVIGRSGGWARRLAPGRDRGASATAIAAPRHARGHGPAGGSGPRLILGLARQRPAERDRPAVVRGRGAASRVQSRRRAAIGSARRPASRSQTMCLTSADFTKSRITTTPSKRRVASAHPRRRPPEQGGRRTDPPFGQSIFGQEVRLTTMAPIRAPYRTGL